MKLRFQPFWSLLAAVGLLAQVTRVEAQPALEATINHVLELEGTGGYVELRPNAFGDLDEATVEACVRWDDLGGTAKRVFNYGDALPDMTVVSEDPCRAVAARLLVLRCLYEGAFNTADLIAEIQGLLGVERGHGI